MQFRLAAKARAFTLRQGIDKPEPGVVPGSQMFGARVAQADE
jgi:hypothetical protein